MKLINDIINELVDTDKSISSPILKTKVLASRLKNEELLNWVSNELKGYEKNEDLSQYRIYSGNVTGTYINRTMQYNNQPVPTIGMNKEFEKVLHSIYLNQSVSSLENLLSDNKSGTLERTFPAEITGLIQDNWGKMGNPYLQLINCKVSVGIGAVTEVLSSVRNSLLDFMLKIDDEFGNITEIEELKTKSKEISTGFWKYFPICVFSLWAMGYSFWLHPKAVFNGFKKGLNDIGIIDLKISESDFMKMKFEELQSITRKEKLTKMGITQWFEFLFWLSISQLILLLPFLMITIGIIALI